MGIIDRVTLVVTLYLLHTDYQMFASDLQLKRM